MRAADGRDVLVIGGGAAGCAAALAAAAGGARVTVVRAALGATALSSGAVDLAADPTEIPGMPAAEAAPLEMAFRRCRAASPEHPLTVAGVSAGMAGSILAGIAEDLPCLNAGAMEGAPLRLPTDMGTLKTTAMASPWAAGADLCGLSGATVGVVGLAGHPGHAAGPRCRLLRTLATRDGVELGLVPLEVPLLRMRGEELAGPADLGVMMERPASLDRLCMNLERQAGQARLTHLLLPPVMGLHGWAEVKRQVEQIRPAAELLSGPPSVPGLRLQGALDSALARRGVTLLHGKAARLLGDGSRLEAVELTDGRRLRGGAFVLATGKFIGGGLRHADGALAESLAGLPVWAGRSGPDIASPGKFMARDAQGPHPLLAAGLRFDPSLRPLDRGAHPAWQNLYGAGSVLGGYDYIAGRDGLGTALITGHLAGQAAAGGPA